MQRIKHIDILRGLAAVSVTLFHLTGSCNLSKQTAQYGSFGWVGVEIFFVISGFILPYSMYMAKYRLEEFGRFMRKRIWRVYPAYLATIVIGIIMALITHRQLPSAVAMIAHLLFLNRLLGYSWISVVFWTLAIEFQFYILIGLLYDGFTKSYIKSLFLILALILISLLLKYIWVNNDVLVFYWFPFFALGVLLFNKNFNAMPSTAFWIAVLTIIIYIYFEFGLPETLAGIFALFFILFYKSNSSKLNRALLWLGKISYSLYLIHWELGRAGVSIARRVPILGHSDGFRLMVGFIVSISSAYLLFIFIEKYSIQYANRIKYRQMDFQPIIETVKSAD
jgi:peptidoglycan/LPS O-acetylase OafA/YrhL